MRIIRTVIPVVALVALMAVAAPGFAKGTSNTGRVVTSGSCSANSTFKLKAKPDDGKLEVEFQVDQNRAGVKWNYRIRRNGKSVAAGTRTTRAPSGSFSVERRIANPAGRDRISAVARRAGETCRASLSI